MLFGPSQIINPLAIFRRFGFGTGAGGGGIPGNAYLTPDGTDYYRTPDGSDYYSTP